MQLELQYRLTFLQHPALSSAHKVLSCSFLFFGVFSESSSSPVTLIFPQCVFFVVENVSSTATSTGKERPTSIITNATWFLKASITITKSWSLLNVASNLNWRRLWQAAHAVVTVSCPAGGLSKSSDPESWSPQGKGLKDSPASQDLQVDKGGNRK